MQSASPSAHRTEISAHRPLSPSTELALIERYQRGDRAAARPLVEGCLHAVVAIAIEYRRTGLSIEDLVQEGNIGLLKALDHFDPDRGVRLGTYAKYWIRAQMRAYIERGYRIVKLGSTKGEQRALWLYRRTGEHRAEELSAMCGLSTERVHELLPLLMANDVSLSPLPGELGPLDRIAHRASTAEELLGDAEERAQRERAVASILAELSPRDQDIARRRLLADEPETLERIGAAWGVSKERVRQLEEGLKARLRERLAEYAESAARAPSSTRSRTRARPGKRADLCARVA
jgi:RNA polymerase sigma-32 factor